jgi:putative endopeptidase
MNKKFYLPLFSLILFMAISCKTENKNNTDSSTDPLDISAIDTSVSASVDFYDFAVGTWRANNPIPPTESRWGSFNYLQDANKSILKDILEKASKNKEAEKGSNTQKLRDFYNTAMDSAAIEKNRLNDFSEIFQKIENVSKENLEEVVASLRLHGASPFFSLYVGADDKNSQMNIAQINQGGLGLPDRDYYLDAKFAEKKTAYQNYVAEIFKAINQKGAKPELAKNVVDFETEIAKLSRARKDLRDAEKNYNKVTLADLQKLAPDFKWETVFKGIQLADYKELIVGQPEVIKALTQHIKQTPIETLKAYLYLQAIQPYRGYLPEDIYSKAFAMYSTTLRGVEVREPRWKRMVSATDGYLGDILGEEFVKVAFKPEAKKVALEMVDEIIKAYAQHIDNLEWMSEETKKKAHEKLNSFTVKVGYPDKWKDYSKLEIVDNSLIRNIMNVNRFNALDNYGKAGKPVDKTEWFMTPPTINAYYNPSQNEIVFPAGILQPPFFSADADPAVNFGGIGGVIGHELTHGFDDQGRKYDHEGNQKDWWTAEDAERFKGLAQKVIDQFNEFNPIDSMHVNGELTLGENIADLGGVAIAFTGFQNYIKKNPQPATISGFTPEQRFFLAWANIWKNNIRDEELKNRLVTDPHSPGKYRVNGPLSNVETFYKAFGIKEGDPMMRPADKRAKIW